MTNTDVVVFLDALSPREVSGVLKKWKQGELDSGVPRVTPRVMSSIYTGEGISENGMMGVSRHGAEDVTRPKKSTIIDQACRSGMNVLAMNMPFCVPFRDVNDDSAVSGHAEGGNDDTQPREHMVTLNVMGPDANIIKDHPDRVYSSFYDYTQALFNQFKDNIRKFTPDVAFLGYRLIDSYCHFQHTESRNGKTYREHLIDDVAHLLKRIETQIGGDLLFFSDHGQTEMTDVFRINKWLSDNEYLDYNINYELVDHINETRGQSHPNDELVENQVGPGDQALTINTKDSVAICNDPYDSSITLLTDRSNINEEEFRQDLLNTGMYRSVKYKWELYDEDDDYYHTLPDLLLDRDEGVFVSGNMHKEPIGMGYYRSGVHDYIGCFGSSTELETPEGSGRNGYLLPEQMYEVIRSFIGLDLINSPIDVNEYTEEEKELIKREL